MKRSPIKRRTPIRRANPERRARKYDRNFSGDGEDGGIRHDHYVRSKPCCICRQPGGVDAAHAIARQMGGAKGRWTDLVPLCRFHHDEHGQLNNAGIFKEYGVDLVQVARDMVRAHLTEIGVI